MFRAQLRCSVRGREKTLPEISQAVQRLTRQAYPAAPSSLQDTLARDHFIDALPDSEMRWCIHQARPKCLRDALTTALEVEAFYVAERHRTRVQARAVLPSSIDPPEPENDLQKQVGELRQVVNQLLTKRDQPHGVATEADSCQPITPVVSHVVASITCSAIARKEDLWCRETTSSWACEPEPGCLPQCKAPAHWTRSEEYNRHCRWSPSDRKRFWSRRNLPGGHRS